MVETESIETNMVYITGSMCCFLFTLKPIPTLE